MFYRFRLFIIKTLLTKEVDIMAKVYATLIIKGKMTFDEVPSTLQEKVRQVLIDLECEDLIA